MGQQRVYLSRCLWAIPIKAKVKVPGQNREGFIAFTAAKLNERDGSLRMAVIIRDVEQNRDYLDEEKSEIQTNKNSMKGC